MCPEFNDEMKDISTDLDVVADENEKSPESDNATEADIIPTDLAEQETQELETKDSESELAEATDETSDETVDKAEEPVQEEITREEMVSEIPEEQEVIPPANNGNYLLFGGNDIPEGINYKDTLA